MAPTVPHTQNGQVDADRALPSKLRGCSFTLGRIGVSFVDRRWLVFQYRPAQDRNLMEHPPEVVTIELTVFLFFCFLWITLFTIMWLVFQHSHPNPFEPGNLMFDLFVLVSVSYIFGNIISTLVHLPPLFGYMIVGIVVRNIPGDPTRGIGTHFAAVAKEVALTIIVCRAGLGLPVLTFLGDVASFRYKTITEKGTKWVSVSTARKIVQIVKRAKSGLLLACTPMAFEAVAYCLMASLVLGFSPIFGLLLGFVMAAVSPAVVVPGLIDLQKRGFTGGGQSGNPVPALVIFASGLDDVFAITCFGVFLGMAFGSGSLVPKIVKAPLEIIGGVAVGFFVGWVLYLVLKQIEPLVQNEKMYHMIDRDEFNKIEEHNIRRYGVSGDNPFAHGKKLPKEKRSHNLIFLFVFTTCICIVIGFSHIEIENAGTLGSCGVLGAMAACLSLNYNLCKDEQKVHNNRNDIDMLHWCLKENPDFFSRDPATRRFFSLKQGQSLKDRIERLENEVRSLETNIAQHYQSKMQLEKNMKRLWDLLACPILFSLVGASIQISDLFNPEVLPKALLIIGVSLVARCVGALVACTGSGWPWMNRFFVALAWMPKATVQAAVGGVAYEEAMLLKEAHCSGTSVAAQAASHALHALSNMTASTQECQYDQELEWAKLILQISVVGIIITAPLGAAAISILGPRWLENTGESGLAKECEPRQSIHEEAHPAPRANPTDTLSYMRRYTEVNGMDEIEGRTATLLGQRPVERQRILVKRSSSFPSSLSLRNPMAVNYESPPDDPLYPLNPVRRSRMNAVGPMKVYSATYSNTSGSGGGIQDDDVNLDVDLKQVGIDIPSTPYVESELVTPKSVLPTPPRTPMAGPMVQANPSLDCAPALKAI